MSLEITCPACGKETLLRREPRYEGFKKVGDTLSCLACGHEFASEEDVPYRDRSGPAVFSEEDRSATVDVFAEDEKGRNCRHCRHYVVNPFTQRCGLHNRVVEATDSCPDFSPPEAESDQDTP
jgi:hypothetical protein